jgi:hypothetical protein
MVRIAINAAAFEAIGSTLPEDVAFVALVEAAVLGRLRVRRIKARESEKARR